MRHSAKSSPSYSRGDLRPDAWGGAELEARCGDTGAIRLELGGLARRGCRRMGDDQARRRPMHAHWTILELEQKYAAADVAAYF